MHEETEAEVLARIEMTRARMGETVEEIGDRVNPDRLQRELKARAREQVQDAKDTMKHKARDAMRGIEHEVNDAGRGLWDTIRENPLPAGMVGVGLAWLVANGATSRRRDEISGEYDRGYRVYPEGASPGFVGYAGTTGYAEAELYERGEPRAGYPAAGTAGFHTEETGESGEGMKDRAAEAADRVRDKAGETADRAREKASEAADRTRDKASELGHRASEGMHQAQRQAKQMTREAGYRARRAERRVEDAVQENPLAAGAIAAALGFAAGMMIPETRREHEMMGPTRDRLMERGERTIRNAGETARDVVRETASESARRVVDEAWPRRGSRERERERVSEPWR